MGMCKECNKVVNFTELKDGYCVACRPELFSEEKLQRIEDFKADTTLKSMSEEKHEETEEASQACGIVALVLSILSFFTGIVGILFAVIGLVCGLKNRKNGLGIAGAIISGIALLIVVLKLAGVAFLIG